MTPDELFCAGDDVADCLDNFDAMVNAIIRKLAVIASSGVIYLSVPKRTISSWLYIRNVYRMSVSLGG